MHDHPDSLGPAWHCDLFAISGKLSALHKGNNSAALKESRLAREDAKKTAAMQMKMMQDQAASMAAIEPPAYEAPPPAPTPGVSGADDAALVQRRAAKTRFGFASSVRGGAKQSMANRASVRPALGGAQAA